MEGSCAAVDGGAEGDTKCEPSVEKECRPKMVECENDDACPSDWRCVNNVVTNCSGSGGGSTDPGVPTDDAGDGLSPSPTPAPDEPDSSGDDNAADGGSTREPVDGKPAPAEGSEPSDGVSDDGFAPDDADRPSPDDTTCTEEPAFGYCMPNNWADFGGSVSPSKDGGAEPPRDGESSDDASSDDDGGVQAGDDDDSESPGAPTAADGAGEADGVKQGGCSTSPDGPKRAAWSLLGLLLLAPLARRGGRSNSERRQLG